MEIVTTANLLKTTSYSSLINWSSSSLSGTHFDSEFPLTYLGKHLKRAKNVIVVEDEKTYKRITVRLYGKGVVLRDTLAGKEIGTKRQFVANKGQLIISRIDARNGAFGIVPDELNGAIVTNDFWLFDYEKVSIDFFSILLSLEKFQPVWQSKSSGTTNRQRVDEQDFLNTKVPMPPVEIQSKLVENYFEKIDAADNLLQKSVSKEKEIESFLFQQLGVDKILSSTSTKTLLQTVRFAQVYQWGYDKLGLGFPYTFSKFAAHNFNDKPSMLLDIFRGKSPKYSDNSAKVILNQKCNRWDQIDLSFAKTVDTTWLASINKDLFTTFGDIIINSTGEGTLGRASLVRDEKYCNLLIDSHMLLLRINTKILNPQFFVYIMNSSFGQKQVELFKGAQATKQTELGVGNVKKIVFPLSPLALQNEIAENVSQMNDCIVKLREQAQTLKLQAKTEFETAIFGS